ncbi:flavodoxin family protein [Aminipila sp.]|uniref:flavodoxin family protein n=1 Tax=Aminipila sp. TaxID=2060095 RepID=UPI0028974DEC|nr:flavodoxin family protein [Aminipila sp.]
MKILAINSSFRGAKGFSHFLITKIFEGAKQQGAECEVINLSEFKMNHCIDCQTCQQPEHYLKCVFDDKDDITMIFNKMREADIIIYSTPVYVFEMSSLLKTLFERNYSTAKIAEFNLTKSGLFFHHVDKNICQKPFVTLVVCDNLENETPKNIISFFKTYAKFMDAEIAGMLVRKSAGMFGFNCKEENKNPVVLSVYDSYIQAGRELAISGKISKQTQKKTNQPMIRIPFFVKIMLKLGFGRKKVLEAHNNMMQVIIQRS